MFEKLLYKIGAWLIPNKPLPRKKCVGCGKRRTISMGYTLWGNEFYCCKHPSCALALHREIGHAIEIFQEAGYEISEEPEKMVIFVGG
jgi:hypothetical protein